MPRSILNQDAVSNSSDIDASVSIGLGTKGIHALTSSGVAIGQNVYGSNSPTTLLNLDKSVLIGSEIFPAATTTGGLGESVVIGSDIGDQTASCSGNLRNIIIGSQSSTTMASNHTDNIIIGSESLKGTTFSDGVVVLGSSAARAHAETGATFVQANAVIIGNGCGRNNTTTTRSIGSSSVLIGCGEFSSGDSAVVPIDSVAIGRGSLSNFSGGGTGQICIGGSNHNTCLIDTDLSTTLRTDSLNNVTTTPTSTTIANLGGADAHVITLLSGSACRVDFTRIGFKMQDVPVLHNHHMTDFDGKSIRGVGSSYWVSGQSNISSPTEKRRMIITPNQAMASDDSSTRSMNVYDGGEGVDDALMPSQHSAVNARMIGGTRVATGSEIYVYFERPPIGWKCTAARLELFNKSSNAASSKKIEIFSRSYITTVDASPSNSDYLTIHVNQALDKRTCTDVTFTVAWTPTSTSYLVGHITAGSPNSIFMGGWVQIERI